MIVWGGSDGTVVTNTGARYTPAGNTWTAVSSGTGAPAARDGQTAIWTGSEMIVWGGRDASGSLSTGARYCAVPCTSPPPTGRPVLSVPKVGATARLAWSAVSGADAYRDIVRGSLAALASSGGDFTAATLSCLASRVTARTFDDTGGALPAPGVWYLVRGVSCGGTATYNSGGPRQ